MRELKFRAWEVTHIMNGDIRKKMYSNDDLLAWEEIPSPMLPNGFNEPLSDGEQWVWMQFTGLKDKNGKEIYEGDILKFVDDDTEYITPISWDGNGLRFVLTVKKPLAFDPDRMVGCKVIGNIYENPELIKAVK